MSYPHRDFWRPGFRSVFEDGDGFRPGVVTPPVKIFRNAASHRGVIGIRRREEPGEAIPQVVRVRRKCDGEGQAEGPEKTPGADPGAYVVARRS
ncbi:MAG: hypothetical protein HYY18_07470 [Planctomycetes bacterium]|nr:hypothetical protein [Planctomycetota bacterium]